MDLHGGNVHRLCRESGVDDLLDFSSNINPLGVPESLKSAIIENLDKLVHYPDPEYVDLKQELASHNGVRPEQIVVGNGATEVIFLYFKALRPKRTLILGPTFAEYERAARASGSEVSYFGLTEAEGFKPDLEALAARLTEGFDLLVVCNPNNPTGHFLTLDESMRIAQLCKSRQCQLLVDEAFIEFVSGGLAASAVGLQQSHIFVVRALTKFFAIPGLRFGFGICQDSELKLQIERDREPWTVNSFAELAAKVVLNDRDYIQSSLAWIEVERASFQQALKQIKGLTVYPSCTNFVLVQLPEITDAERFCSGMLKLGIMVRNAANFPFLNSRFVRFAIKSKSDNEKVIAAIESVLNGRD